MGRNPKERGYMYLCGWFTLLHSRNEHNIVKQPHSCLLSHAGRAQSGNDSFWPHGLEPTRLLCPWDFPAKNPGVDCVSFSRGSSRLRDWTCVFCAPVPAPAQPLCDNCHLTPNTCPLSWWCHLTLIICCPLLLLHSILPSIRVFSSDLALCIRWPKDWDFSFSILKEINPKGNKSWIFSIESWASASALVLPINIQDWFHLGLTDLISLQFKGLSRVFCSTTIRKHQFFITQPPVHDYWKNRSFDYAHFCLKSNVSVV